MATKKKVCKKVSTLTEFYNEVARKADTNPGQSIDVATTKRVMAAMFDTLEDLTPCEMTCVLSAGLKRAGVRRA